MLKKNDLIKTKKNHLYIVVDIDNNNPNIFYLSKYDKEYDQFDLPKKTRISDLAAIETIQKTNSIYLKIYFKYKQFERLLTEGIENFKSRPSAEEKAEIEHIIFDGVDSNANKIIVDDPPKKNISSLDTNLDKVVQKLNNAESNNTSLNQTRSEGEDKIIKTKVIIPLPNEQIKEKNMNTGIIKGRVWTEEEKQYVRENWGVIEDTAIANNLDRTLKSIRGKANALGLGPQKNILDKPKQINKPSNNHPWKGSYKQNLAPYKAIKSELEEKHLTDSISEIKEKAINIIAANDNKKTIDITVEEAAKVLNDRNSFVYTGPEGFTIVPEEIGNLKAELYEWKHRFQRVRETTFAIVHYTNNIRADELLDFMDKLQDNPNYEPIKDGD